jgi:hypothetical protein
VCGIHSGQVSPAAPSPLLMAARVGTAAFVRSAAICEADDATLTAREMDPSQALRRLPSRLPPIYHQTSAPWSPSQAPTSAVNSTPCIDSISSRSFYGGAAAPPPVALSTPQVSPLRLLEAAVRRVACADASDSPVFADVDIGLISAASRRSAPRADASRTAATTLRRSLSLSDSLRGSANDTLAQSASKRLSEIFDEVLSPLDRQSTPHRAAGGRAGAGSAVSAVRLAGHEGLPGVQTPAKDKDYSDRQVLRGQREVGTDSRWTGVPHAPANVHAAAHAAGGFARRGRSFRQATAFETESGAPRAPMRPRTPPPPPGDAVCSQVIGVLSDAVYAGQTEAVRTQRWAPSSFIDVGRGLESARIFCNACVCVR